MTPRKPPAKKTTTAKKAAATPAKKAAPRRRPSTSRPNLRAVGDDEKPDTTTAKKRVMTITAAADSGDTRDLLVAMRARLAKSIDDPNCPPRDLAALSRRLHEINRDIEAIDAAAAQEANESGEVPDEDFDTSAL